MLQVVRISPRGGRRNDRANHMSTQEEAGAPVNGSLKSASLDRLACLLRHWAWADEARTAFDRELASGWDYDDDPMSDHPFGSYYHWCALLCGFSEAALEHGLLSPLQHGCSASDEPAATQ
jgi:hypothetical protein